jgi:hypothetical protein
MLFRLVQAISSASRALCSPCEGVKGTRRDLWPTTLRRTALTALYGLICLTGCAPARHSDELAASYGFARRVVTGTLFSHVLYRNHWPPRAEAAGGLLDVYLEGDGLPWRTRYAVSSDPTPRDPLALRLMRLDPAPAVYLGRPCYNGQAALPGCNPRMWTSGRYGVKVVASMEAALNRVMASGHFSGVILIGYSGGGTLAMLLARRVKATQGVITVAGNLDPARWVKLHHYSPLTESMDPVDESPLNSRIKQAHYVGRRDRNVPADLVRSVVERQPDASLVVIDEFDHRCCWEAVWPSIIASFRVTLTDSRRSQ